MISKPCSMCGGIIKITAPAQKYCAVCKKIAYKHQVRKDHIRDMIKRGREDFIGKGSGCCVGKGKSCTNYKTGIGLYKSIRDSKFQKHPSCSLCGKNLLGLTCHYWCGHHIDGNRNNNEETNIGIVCKSCHQKYHETHLNFKGSTTIP